MFFLLKIYSTIYSIILRIISKNILYFANSDTYRMFEDSALCHLHCLWQNWNWFWRYFGCQQCKILIFDAKKPNYSGTFLGNLSPKQKNSLKAFPSCAMGFGLLAVRLVTEGLRFSQNCTCFLQGWEFAHSLITHLLISLKSNERL